MFSCLARKYVYCITESKDGNVEPKVGAAAYKDGIALPKVDVAAGKDGIAAPKVDSEPDKDGIGTQFRSFF